MELNPSKGKCESSIIYLLNEIECLVSKGLASELFCWLSSSCCVGIRRTVSAPVTAARAGTIAASMPAATPSQHLSQSGQSAQHDPCVETGTKLAPRFKWT